MGVNAEGIRVELGGRLIVDDAFLVADPGQMVGLVGPNGSGKTTLLRTIYKGVRPVAGLVEIDGTDVRSLSTGAMARRTAVLTQERTGDFDLTVEEIVRMGRTPHKRTLQLDTLEDARIIDEAMHRVDVAAVRNKLMSTLSGGERQRVMVARTLAQQSRVLLLDEPTNHLDIRHQLELLDLVRTLGVEHGITTVIALHDLNLAATYCDSVYVLSRGQVVTGGPAIEVLSGDMITRIFGVDVDLETDPRTLRPRLFFSLPPAG